MIVEVEKNIMKSKLMNEEKYVFVDIEDSVGEFVGNVRQEYNDELEFLWEKFDDIAIWRNKQYNKWYGLIMKISE